MFHSSLAECQAALPQVLALQAPTTVWTGDKDPNAAVRARFTPQRDPPLYFLLWVPLLVAATVLLVSGVQRLRHARSGGARSAPKEPAATDHGTGRIGDGVYGWDWLT